MIQSKSAGTKLLNRRGEWGQNLPPRLVLEDQGDEGTTGKRKVDRNLVLTPEEGTGANGIQVEDPGDLDKEVQRKRRKLDMKERAGQRPKLAPPRAENKSIKEMIAAMGARRQKGAVLQGGQSGRQEPKTGSRPPDDQIQPSANPNFGATSVCFSSESRQNELALRQPGVKQRSNGDAGLQHGDQPEVIDQSYRRDQLNLQQKSP